MKKKMIYKLDETQNIIVEVETEEQERQILREKISKNQIAAFGLGVTAILLFNV